VRGLPRDDGMILSSVAGKAASHGVRHILQLLDYRLGLGMAPPTKVQATLTHRCNCRCVMCDLWKWRDQESELAAKRWIEILEELQDWAGTFRVNFSGGEVLLKPGVYRILRRAVKLCARPCSSLCHRSHSLRDKVKLFARYARDGRL